MYHQYFWESIYCHVFFHIIYCSALLALVTASFHLLWCHVTGQAFVHIHVSGDPDGLPGYRNGQVHEVIESEGLIVALLALQFAH